MEIRSVLIEGSSYNPLMREEALVKEHADKLGIPVTVASTKMISRGRVFVNPDTLAVGSVSFVKAALRKLGKQLPEHTPYPDVLKSILHREVKQVAALKDALKIADRQRVFIKPQGWKRFTGLVPDNSLDYRLAGVSRHTPVWVATPVNFISEWRVYVVKGLIESMRFADHGGDRNKFPSVSVVVDSIGKLQDAGVAPDGYVIDFGVLDTGETALVEMNDGFSFGAYDDIPAEEYWNVTVARWAQLIA